MEKIREKQKTKSMPIKGILNMIDTVTWKLC